MAGLGRGPLPPSVEKRGSLMRIAISEPSLPTGGALVVGVLEERKLSLTAKD